MTNQNRATFTTSQKTIGLIGWLILVFAIAAIGAFASANAPDFYRELVRPTWAPPGWLFGPVWAILYAGMGVAAWLVWRVAGFSGALNAMVVFFVQLAANALWTWLFFVWRLGALAFVEIIILWLLIVMTIVLFKPFNKVAAALLLPYLAWVTFASALTFATWRLNPALLG
jgi:benzodiazapine receptor